MPKDLSDEAIKNADKDGDGMITYVEYFQFIDNYICFRVQGKIDPYIEFNHYSKIPTPQKLVKN